MVSKWLYRPWVMVGFLVSAAVIVIAFNTAVGGPAWLTGICATLAAFGAIYAFVDKRWARERANKALVDRHLEAPRKRLRDLTAFSVGTSRPRTPQSWDDSQALGYVLRAEVDASLETALRDASKPFLLVVGPSKSGKSRTAFEAVRRVYPDRWLVAPSNQHSLDELLRLDPPFALAGSVVWLDDLERYLPVGHGEGMTRRLVKTIAENPETCVVATIRRSEYEKYSPGGDEITREVENLLTEAVSISLPPLTELPTELASCNLPFAQEVARVGLGAALVGGPELVDRLRNGANPIGAAMVRAAVDWRRGGGGHTPESGLRGLCSIYLRDGRAQSPSEESLDAGLDWACCELWPDSGIALLASSRKRLDFYAVPDYLLDAADADVPNEMWDALAETAPKARMVHVGAAAWRASHGTVAVAALTRAAQDGDTKGMFLLGGLLREQGHEIEAEKWVRKAAEADDAVAMAGLGTLLDQRGEATEAEVWFRRAAEADHAVGMAGLGALLKERGDEIEAEVWLRRAAEASDAKAMSNLGALLAERGDEVEAEVWLRKAAETGEPGTRGNFGVLLAHRGDEAEAMEWFRKGAEAGEVFAMARLGERLAQRGEIEAEVWLRKAAEADEATAMGNLGLLLAQRGDESEAEDWLRKGAEAGDVRAMAHLGALCAQQGNENEAEPWLRKAAAANYTPAIGNLGVLLAHQGKDTEAEACLRKGAETGLAVLMENLSEFLEERGKSTEAQEWHRRAAEAGDK